VNSKICIILNHELTLPLIYKPETILSFQKPEELAEGWITRECRKTPGVVGCVFLHTFIAEVSLSKNPIPRFRSFCKSDQKNVALRFFYQELVARLNKIPLPLGFPDFSVLVQIQTYNSDCNCRY
jgi:hypothetical protein